MSTFGLIGSSRKLIAVLEDVRSVAAVDCPVLIRGETGTAIQEQEVERLGSSQPIRVDVRIVAATNQDLEQMLADRRFRLDLYYRLNVFPITVPRCASGPATSPRSSITSCRSPPVVTDGPSRRSRTASWKPRGKSSRRPPTRM